MNRQLLLKNFSRRLVSLLQESGRSSTRARIGVKVSELARVSGCSHQMARRYALGDALPEIDVLFKIAKWLKVSPGWLLFGQENQEQSISQETDLIHIEPELLHYILLKSAPLFLIIPDSEKLVSFILDIIRDVTLLEVDKKARLKVIDLSLSMATKFVNTQGA